MKGGGEGDRLENLGRPLISPWGPSRRAASTPRPLSFCLFLSLPPLVPSSDVFFSRPKRFSSGDKPCAKGFFFHHYQGHWDQHSITWRMRRHKYHPGTVWALLDRFPVGYLADHRVSSVSKDYRRLIAEFACLGLFDKKGHGVLRSFTFMVFLLVASVSGVLFSTSVLVRLISASLMGLLSLDPIRLPRPRLRPLQRHDQPRLQPADADPLLQLPHRDKRRLVEAEP